MPHLETLAAGPWVLLVVFVVAGLDALLPFMPSESTVVAVGVAAAGTGRPQLGLLIAVASAGAWGGDVLSYALGRRNDERVTDRLLRGRRSAAAYRWVHRLLHGRGGLVIVFARYLPAGRSATAFAAGVVGYPAGRFTAYTALGVTLWSAMSALLGYAGGHVFAGRPVLGFLLAGAGALTVTGTAMVVRRYGPGQPSASSTPVSRGPRNTGSRPDSESQTAFTAAPRSRKTDCSQGPR